MRAIITLFAVAGPLAFGALDGIPTAAGHGSVITVEGSHQDTHMEGGHMEGGQKDGHHAGMPDTFEEIRALHAGHRHDHDFEAIEEMTPEQRARMFGLMHEIGVAMPPMDPERGRHLFAEKACVACHSVNGVGGDLGPALDAATMPRPMNVFEFAARMWRGAEAMAALQHDLLGEVISLDGQDLADLIAFAHDEDEQRKLAEDQIPEHVREAIQH
jgi:hypothetical protein